MDLAGKVIAVTGGGNGIGRQLVLQLLARNAHVAAADIRQDSLDETARRAEASAPLSTHILDVTDREAVSAFPAEVIDIHGHVDGYISNAGIIQPFVRLSELEYEAIDRVIDVNLYGTIHIAKAFLPHLLERPEAHLTNLSSMGGFLPVPGQTVYGAAKAGVKLLTEGMYAELIETNVGVSVVMPGAVSTEITSNSGVAAPVDPESSDASGYRTTSPEDAASIILDGIERDKLHIYVGRDARMMSVATRTAPRRSTHLIYRQMKDLLD